MTASLLGVQAGARFLNIGLPGEHDPSPVIIVVDSVTNSCQLNCRRIHSDGQESLATIGMADFCAAMASGLLVAER